MSSFRAVLIGILGAAVFATSVNAKVNIIYPPKRKAVQVEQEHVPSAGKSSRVSQAVTAVIIKKRHRYSRQELVKHQLFRTWSGFVDVYSGPRYPDEWQAPRYPF